MSSYELAFTAGERQAHMDRGTARNNQRPPRTLSDTEAAWWDGYCPRNPAWTSSAARPFAQSSVFAMAEAA